MNLPLYLLFYLVLINMVAFGLCFADKKRAVKGQWRIKESSLMVAGLLGGAFGLLLGMRLFRHKTKHLKFTLLVPLQCLLWGVVLVHTLSALTLDSRIQYLEVTYSSDKVSPQLDGYLIAFVTDTHALPADELTAMTEEINRFAPDLLVLGGDFPSAGDAPFRAMEILAQVKAPDGIYGVEGNHDDYQVLFEAMERVGIQPLSNSGVSPRATLYLAGVEDLWNRTADIEAAVQGAGEDDFVLLLAHNPDVTMEQDTSRVNLTLSGHTHGGQITLFGLWAPALSLTDEITAHGQRFHSGWATSRDGSDVFVSNGAGTFHNVPRVFARPQVILITLAHAG